MAIYTQRSGDIPPTWGTAPYGNFTAIPYKLQLDKGVWKVAGATKAVAANDVLRLGIIPAGFMATGAEAVVSTGFTTGTTANIGFSYVDGYDDAGLPADADYLFTALGLATVASTKASGAVKTHVLAKFPKQAHLELTNLGAAQAASGELDVLLFGIAYGPGR